MRPLLLLFALAYFASVTMAQDLPRRSFLGVKIDNLTPDMRNMIGIEGNQGVLISNVIPRSTAAAAGFLKGDILLTLNGQPFSESSDVVQYVGKQKSGSRFQYSLIRDKKRIDGTASFLPYPKESYADLDVEYTDVKSTTGLQRIILTRSRKPAGRMPLVVFIGGIGCYSLDAPMDTGRSETQLLNALARQGFMTARLEKPGIGDGAGYSKPCNEISFTEETEAYAAAIKKLQQRKDVQADAVYVIGHSMGGVFAPIVARSVPIEGIIAYGTIGSNFLEYLMKTRRTIGEAYEWAPEETDAFVKDACECAALYFAGKMTTEEAIRKKADCRDHLSVFDLRSREYNDELYGFNIPALWKDYKGKVLLLWGESDFIAAKHDHELLLSAINHYHQGSASFAPVKDADHGMNIAGSFQAARTSPGPYNREVEKLILSWLKRQS